MLGRVSTLLILSSVLGALSGEIDLVCINGCVAQQIDHVVSDDEHQSTAFVQPIVGGKSSSSSPCEAPEFVTRGTGWLSGREPDRLVAFERKHPFKDVARKSGCIVLR